jgi:hypothetical protein
MDRGRPSKRIFFLIFACLAFVGSIGWAVSKTNAPAREQDPITTREASNTAELAENSVKQNMEQDTDGDGLLNWEETLWETDSKNSDSDRDGTNDGDEVKAGRNPKVAGPNDTVMTGAVAGGTSGAGSAGATSEIVLDDSETGKISRDLFANYLRAKQTGAPIESDMQNAIVQKALYDKSLTLQTNQFTESSVVLRDDVDLRTYGNGLGRAFAAGATSDTVSELDILHKALTEDNPTELTRLTPIIDKYTQIVAAILITPAPKEYAKLHMQILNDTNNLLSDIKGMKEIFNDPIVGLLSVGKYYQDVQALRSSVTAVTALFASNGITFEPNEFGSMFARAQ